MLLRVLERWRTTQAPRGVQPTVEWQVAGACNYDCSYCIQSRKRRRGQPSRALLERIVAELARLPGRWEIKVSGGEPLVCRDFVDFAVPALMASSRHALSLLTNFSAPLAELERFAQATGDRLRVFSASFHPEFTTIDDFVDKARSFAALRQRYNPGSSFVVNVVLSPQNLPLQPAWKAALEAAGLRYYPQVMKVGAAIYPYTESEWQQVLELAPADASPREANRVPSYTGRRCWAGAWYFVVDQQGAAFRCRPARRLADDDDDYQLGSLADGSFGRREAWRCPFAHCPCSVPANRGMVEGLSSGEASDGD